MTTVANEMRLAKAPDLAIFVPSLRGGGAERVALRLATRFASQGISVDLLLAQVEGPYLRDVPAGVRVVDLKAQRVLQAVRPLARYLKKNNPPAMLTLLNYANLAGLLSRRLSGWKGRLVISERNSLQPLFAKRTLNSRVYRYAMKLLYPSAAAIVVLSEGLREEAARLLHLPATLLRVIPNPVDSAEIRAQAQAPSPHRWLDEQLPPVIVAAGRMTVQKDYPTLFKAFLLLRNTRACRLIVLGDGPLRSNLVELAHTLSIADDVAMPGFVDNPVSYMSRAQLFVMSSIHEGLPNVLLEAMAAGSRIVSTDCAGSPAEILEHGRWGRLVPVGDAAALALAMAEALDDPSPPDVKSRATHFNIDSIADKYADALNLVGRQVHGQTS